MSLYVRQLCLIRGINYDKLEKKAERVNCMNKPSALSLSMISHELGNPLTLIHSTLQLLGCHYPEVTKHPLWPQLILDIDYMSQLLSELSSLNSSQNLKYARIDIRQFLTNMTGSFSSEVQKQNKTLSFNIETSQTLLYGDALKLREVFMNLIKNAMEATSDGDQILIDVKSKWNCLVFQVSDTGCGMDEERVKTIFEPFTTYKSNGTGLGLTIVKNIIEAHGGRIQVYSRLSEGTCFVILLPLKPPKMK